MARSLAGPSADAKDMVTQAFARVLAASRRGEGPDESLRPALLSDIANSSAVTGSTPDASAPDPRRLVAAAFADLPERWQLVLWHTEVERERPAEVARLLGIDARGVAALVARARSGLRERYRQAHLASTTDPACRPTVDRLPAYANRELSAEEVGQVQGHLDACDRCRLLVAELADGNPMLRTLLATALLGSAAAAYLAAGGALAGILAAVRRIVGQRYVQVGAGAVAATAAVALVLALVSPPSFEPDRPGEAAGTLPVAPGTGGPPAKSTPGPVGPGAATTGSPSGGPATSDAAGMGAAAPGAAAGIETLRVTLEPVNALARGRPALLRLTITNTLTNTDLSDRSITATVSLPSGVTLRHGNAGPGWTCTGAGSIVTCTRAGLEAGKTSNANLHVSVARDAADGVPSVQVTGAGIPSVNAVASQGVVDKPGRDRGGPD